MFTTLGGNNILFNYSTNILEVSLMHFDHYVTSHYGSHKILLWIIE